MAMKKNSRAKVLIYLSILVVFLALLFVLRVKVNSNSAQPLKQAMVIHSLRTDKSRYLPGEMVKMTANISNKTNKTLTQVKLSIFYYHLNQTIGHKELILKVLKANSSKILTWEWLPPKNDYQGYLVTATLKESELVKSDPKNTAVDVSSTWTKFPRYGFIANFPQQSANASEREIEQLNTYHIDGLQFYDWQWKQHVPLAGSVSHPASTWHDIANRTNYRQTILDLINSGHKDAMVAMNYNLLYGAWNGYGQDNSGVSVKWGLFNSQDGSNQVNYPLPSNWNAQQLFVFNPGNPNWQKYIFDRELEVFKAYPFDGWQVDQLGDLGNLYDYKGNPVNLTSDFVSFLDKAQKILHKQLIFNNVGTFGLYDTAPLYSESPLYIETWEQSGQTSYSDLKETIDTAKNQSHNKKSVVLAAYMDNKYAQKFSSENKGKFNTPGVLLTDATIFASGGDHIELGDGDNMLNAPYFPNHNLVMSKGLQQQIKNYYDFIVAYENLLRGDLVNSRNIVEINGIKTSSVGTPGTVWSFTKSGKTYDTIHLINMLGQKFAMWRDSNANYQTPPIKKNIKVKYYYSNTHIANVYVASPDVKDGDSIRLNYIQGSDSKGNYITFKLPSLKYWDMVYIQKIKNR